jgi:hypothetical protein
MPTAIQPQLIEGPGGGVVTHMDPRHVPETAWSNCRNVRFPTGGSRIRKTDGYTRIDNTPPGEPLRALWHYLGPSLEQHLVRITTGRALFGTGSGITQITDANYQPATIDQVVTVTQYKETMIWADGGQNPVMAWNMSPLAGPLFPERTIEGEVFAQGVPNGKLVEMHKSRLLLGHITKSGIEGAELQPWKVLHSAVGHPEDMEGNNPESPDTAGDIDFVDDNDPIIALKVLGNDCIVHKPSRLYRMIAIGPPQFYQVEQIPADDGAISARAAISIGSFQFFMGRGNFYRLASFTEPLGDAVWPEIERHTDWSKAHRIYAYRRQEYDEVCWKIPQLGGADLSAVFNYRDQSWTFTDHDPGTCYAELPQVPFLTPTAVSHLPPMVGIFGQMTGHVQAYDTVNADGAAIHAWAESKHFNSGLLPAKILAIACYATGNGFLTVRLRAAMEARHPLPPWPSAINVHPSSIYVLPPPPSEAPSRPDLPVSQTRPWLDVREYGRLWQIRIESGGLNDDWELSAYGPAIIPGGYAR